MPGNIFLGELAFKLDDHFPRFRISLGEKLLGVLDEQCVDVDHMPLNLQVVRTSAQLDQCAGDDVDEAPGELTKGRRVTFTTELSCNARRHFRDTTETSHGVVAGGDLWPA
ncbi:hypothetical protein D3C81_2039340 [compost metagenome]